MAPVEWAHRLAQALARRASKRRTFGWTAFAARGTLRPLGALAHPLRAQAETLAPQARAAVEAFRGGAFAALGARWPRGDASRLFPQDNWRLDPVSGRLWPGPETFCFDVPYRHDKLGRDVKHVWEFNRLPFLPLLAADVTLNGASAGIIDDALASWRAANPPFQGLAWASGIELALRVVAVALALGWAGEALAPATREAAESLLRAHHYWLRRFPSRHSSANNHAVAEALGELIAELFVPDLGDGLLARATLEREALKQILPDGLGAEQSPTYAAFTVEMLLTADLFLRAAGREPLSLAVRGRLAAFSGAVAWLAGADGRLPRIGDDDEGRVMSFGREGAYPAAVAQASAAAHGAPLWPPCAQASLRDAFWPPRPAPSPPQGVRVFADGGLTIVRERRAGRALRLVFDHGPLGYLAIAAHGHADANAIWLSLDDEDIFVDAGTYAYHSSGAWRDGFRGTAAHNTLMLDGRDQSPIWGPFLWGPPARARLVAAETGPNWRLSAVHDGYRRRYGVLHARELHATPTGFALIDRLLGRPCAREAACGFLLAPGLSALGSGLDWRVKRGERTLLRLAFSAPGEVGVHCGEATGRGWVSSAFGEKTPAPQIVWRGRLPPKGLGVDFAF